MSVLSLLFFFNLEMYGVVLLGFTLMSVIYLDEEYSWVFKLSDVNFWMMVLVIILFLMLSMVETYYKMSMNILLSVLYLIVCLSDFFQFYLCYEMVFVLIMFTIILLGYSYERLMAGFLMMFYSFVFSSPVLMMMMVLDYSFLMKEWLNYTSAMSYFLVGSFAVKFPIFGFHYWLPVAHVEASTVGSMLLAGVLLKLGSVGVIYMVSYLKFMIKLHWLSMSVGVVMVSILVLSDLKIMIAYSSVAHMSMVFYVLMLGHSVGKKGAVYMMFYHGFISPLMFWVVGMLAWWKTRSLLVVKMISFSSVFLMCLFLLCILNMSFPPFMGFLSEILMLKSLVHSKYVLGVMMMSVLFSCYYNVYLYWCFNGVSGSIHKINMFSMDLIMFLGLAAVLNF